METIVVYFVIMVLLLVNDVLVLSQLDADNLPSCDRLISINKDFLRWIFVNYHKTGHLVGLNFMLSFTKRCKLKHAIDYFSKNIYKSLSELQNPTVTLHEPNMYFKWDIVFNQTYQWKLIHFLRDPYDTIISGYLYHSQINVEQGEMDWLIRRRYNPCSQIYINDKMNESIDLDLLAQELSLFSTSSTRQEINKMLGDAKMLCLELYQKYSISIENSERTYHTVLRRAGNLTDIYDGIRLEALRSILSAYHATIYTMTLNHIRASESQNIHILPLFLHELPIDNQTTSIKTIQKIIDFLIPSEISTKSNSTLLWNCMTKKEALTIAYDSILINNKNKNNSEKSSKKEAKVKAEEEVAIHITSGILSYAMKINYIQRLKNDKVLGPLLTLISSILYSTPKQIQSKTRLRSNYNDHYDIPYYKAIKGHPHMITHTNQWIIINYHYTNITTTSKIINSLFSKNFYDMDTINKCNIHSIFFNDANQNDNNIINMLTRLKCLSNKNIIAIQNTQLPLAWNKIFDSNDRILHIIDEPYVMIIRAYVTHKYTIPVDTNIDKNRNINTKSATRQNPRRNNYNNNNIYEINEGIWIHRNDYNPCDTSTKILASKFYTNLTYAALLLSQHTTSIRLSNSSELYQALISAEDLCNSLYNSKLLKFGATNKSTSFLHIIQHQVENENENDIYDSIRLEALRMILSGYRNTLLQMAINTANIVNFNKISPREKKGTPHITTTTITRNNKEQTLVDNENGAPPIMTIFPYNYFCNNGTKKSIKINDVVMHLLGSQPGATGSATHKGNRSIAILTNNYYAKQKRISEVFWKCQIEALTKTRIEHFLLSFLPLVQQSSISNIKTPSRSSETFRNDFLMINDSTTNKRSSSNSRKYSIDYCELCKETDQNFLGKRESAASGSNSSVVSNIGGGGEYYNYNIYISKLKQDSIIGPLLDLIREIIFL